MRSLRIAHIADTHLGYKYSALQGRDDDFARSWLHACRAIVDSYPDVIIHAGDVFHSHRPDWKALTAFNDGMRILLKARAPIFVIAGNHDTSSLNLSHNVFTFMSSLFPQVIVTNDTIPLWLSLDELELEMVLVPHKALLNKELEWKVQEIVDQLDPDKLSILVSHGGIGKDDETIELGSVVIPNSITKHPWNYIALGHLHLSQPHGKKGWYSGSTERCGWSDYPASPAWTLAIVSSKTAKHTQQSVPHMEMIQLPELNCEGMSDTDVYVAIAEALDRVVIPQERSHLRMKLNNLPARRRMHVETFIRRSLAKNNPAAAISIVTGDVDNTLGILEISEPSHQLKTITEYFEDFVKERNYADQDFSSRFMEKGLDLMAQVQAENNAESE